MTLDEIRELIQLVTDTGVAELEVQRGENRVRIRRGGVSQDIAVPESTGPRPAAAHVAVAAPVSADGEEAVDESLVMVKSPIVGTFYEAASPGIPPFVQVGDAVHPGQVLCIIESMKLMNEIECEVAGTVVSKLVTNAQPVEYGEALFAIQPA